MEWVIPLRLLRLLEHLAVLIMCLLILYSIIREVLFDYLKGRWSQEDIQKYIKFSTVVRDVVYNKATDDFTVSVKDLKNAEVMDGER